MVEVWKSIPDLPFYEASNLGRIRSVTRYKTIANRWGGKTTRIHYGRVLAEKLKPNGCGGFYASFYSDGGKYIQVNRAVCSAWNGRPPSDRHEAAHLDGDSTNNAATNLVWATPTENASHKVSHGTAPRGIKNGCAKLSDVKVRNIRSSAASGTTKAELAKKYKVSISVISLVTLRKSWTHVR